jgi:hypothetical protein
LLWIKPCLADGFQCGCHQRFIGIDGQGSLTKLKSQTADTGQAVKGLGGFQLPQRHSPSWGFESFDLVPLPWYRKDEPFQRARFRNNRR